MRVLVLLLSGSIAASAAVPSIREIYPRGAQRGKTLTIYLLGEGLVRGAKIRSTLPASFSQMTLSRDPLSEQGATAKPETVLPYLVEIKADVPLGLYPIRVLTPDGISNVVLFPVGDLPEVDEVEWHNPKQPNNFPAEAQKVSAPAVINGTLAGPDVDYYSFLAKAGQKLVFEVEARRAGSAVDPVVTVFDPAGKEIASNNDSPGLGVDARLEASFAKAGEYRVEVHDAKFSEQTADFYRLKIGAYPYADTVFPLGGRRGEIVPVTLSGGNLAAPVKVDVDFKTKGSFVPVRLPGSSSLPLLLAVSDSPEMVESESLTSDVVVNGRIQKAGEIDRYKLTVAQGEKWVFELAAASLGTSPLDAVLTVVDGAGKKLASADDGNGIDPVLPFTVPEGITEITVLVEDLLGRGGQGFGYRLLARKMAPDFVVDLATPFVNVPAGGTAQVVAVVQRRGYDGPMRLKILGLPEGFVVSGGHVASEAAAQIFNNDNAGRRTARSVLTITAPADVTQQVMDLSVIAETPDGTIRRKARGPGLVTAVRGDRQRAVTAPWLDAELPMATSAPPPVTIDVATLRPRFSQGFEYVLAYNLKRREGARTIGRVTQQIASSVGNLRILRGEPGKSPDQGSYLVNTNFATPITWFDMLLETQVDVDGKTVTVSSPVIEVEVVPGYELTLTTPSHVAAPQFEIAGKVRREPTFEGAEIRVKAEDLPDGVSCSAAEVAPDSRAFSLKCESGAGAPSGTHEIRITSVAPNTGRKAKADYKIADISTKLVVAGTNRGDK